MVYAATSAAEAPVSSRLAVDVLGAELVGQLVERLVGGRVVGQHAVVDAAPLGAEERRGDREQHGDGRAR